MTYSATTTYKIDSVVLLTLKNDNTTDTGTFYSTNYFFKELKEKFPQNKFDVLDISPVFQTDSLILDKLIGSIKRNNVDLEILNSSEIGDSLDYNRPDAIILGQINNTSKDFHFWFEPNLTLKCKWSSGCNFTYYMVSLKDGKVLWMSNVLGATNYEEIVSYTWDSDWESYPPLDMAISNGIDMIIDSIPLKKML